MRARLIAAAATIFVAAIGGGCTKAGSSAAKDVTVSACDADPSGGKPVARGEIHNTSSEASSYTIHVKFVDSAGNGVGDGAAVVAKVDASGTASWDATGTQSAKGPLKCELESVTRTAAP
ncbi:MAG TPA: FxLYD domain-containing protein [Acidimicrobiales bacterium]|jgi:hypothetical protein